MERTKPLIYHNLARVLERLQQRGLTLNLKKCWFLRDAIEFYGLQLSSRGVQPTSEKIRAITEAPRPTNASDLRSFLGTVGFSSRFIPDFSTTAEPLRRLMHKGTPFVWTDTHQRAFDRLRQQLGDAAALAYYDKDAPTQVIADASPVGLRAVLVQEQNEQRRAVCYASRTLTSVERRYSQTEKEALALVCSCERLHQFLYGMDFEFVTDHKPLQTIYSPTSKPSAPIERWVLRLQPFTFRVRYVPGPQNIADALSRLPANHLPADYTGETATEESIYTMTTLSASATVSIRDIVRASANDTELQSVRQFVKTGDAAHLPRPYLPLRYELTTIGQVVLRGTRIVTPASLRSQILQLAHEGQQGIVKTKERLHTKVWWPGIDHSAERLCKACTGCQVVSRPMAPPPVKSTPLPQHPWEHLATDILGPLLSGESLLVTVDYFSRFFEVDILCGTTSAAVITRLHAHFARYGVCHARSGLTTDRSLHPKSLQPFLLKWVLITAGTRHSGRANGEGERQNRSLLKILQIAHAEHRPWRPELLRFLQAYRTTPHSTTGVSPVALMFRHPVRSKLPAYYPDDATVGSEPPPSVMRDCDAEHKRSTADYADKTRHATDRDTSPGDQVWLRNTAPANKLTPMYHLEPFKVTACHGDQITVESTLTGSTLKRKHTKPVVKAELPEGEGQTTQEQPAAQRKKSAT